MWRGRAFWGLLLILIGALFMLNNLGLLPVSLGDLFWPLILVLVGVRVLLRGSRPVTRLESESASLGRQGAAQARLRLQHGAGRLWIEPGAGSEEIFEGEFSGGVEQEVNRSGDVAHVTLSVPRDRWMDLPFGGKGGIEWKLKLASDLAYEIELEAGAGENKLDLTNLRVTSLTLKTGASSTEVDLPTAVEQGRVRVEAGMASVVLRVPQAVAARITSESGLAALDIDTSRYPKVEGAYQSAEYGSAEHNLDIHIQSGLASIKVL